MQGHIRTLVNPPTTLADYEREKAAKQAEQPERFTHGTLLAEHKRGIFVNGDDRPAVFLSDGDHCTEIEPAASATSIIVWSWDEDGHSGCTFASLDDFEQACLIGLQYVAQQRAR